MEVERGERREMGLLALSTGTENAFMSADDIISHSSVVFMCTEAAGRNKGRKM